MRGRLFLAILGVLAVSGAARADGLSPPSQLKPGLFFGFAEAFRQHVDTPTINGAYSNNGSTHVSYFDGPIDIDGGRLALGYSLGATLPRWVGQNFRLSASYALARGDATESGATTLATGGWNRINGNQGAGAGGTFHHRTHIDIDTTQWTAEAATDYAIGSKFLLTPSLAYVGGRQKLKAHVRNYFVNVDDLIIDDVTLKTNQHGAKIGLTATYRIVPSVDLFAGATASRIRKSTSMSGVDCSQDTAAVGSVNGSCNGDAWRSSATDKASATSTETSLALGVTYRPFEHWFLGASISMIRDSDVAGYRMPTPADTRAASIRFEATDGYQASIRTGFFF